MHCRNQHPGQPLHPELSLIKMLELEAKGNLGNNNDIHHRRKAIKRLEFRNNNINNKMIEYEKSSKLAHNNMLEVLMEVFVVDN